MGLVWDWSWLFDIIVELTPLTISNVEGPYNVWTFSCGIIATQSAASDKFFTDTFF